MADVYLTRLIADGSAGGSTIPGSTYYPTKISLRLRHSTGTGNNLTVTPLFYRCNTSTDTYTLLEEGSPLSVTMAQTTFSTYESSLPAASAIAATTATEILAVGFRITGATGANVDIEARSGDVGDFTSGIYSGEPSDYTSITAGEMTLASSDTALMWVDIDTSPLPVTGTLSETEDDDTMSASGNVASSTPTYLIGVEGFGYLANRPGLLE